MKQFFLLALLLSCIALSAQKTRIGFVNGDSLLNAIPEYKEAKQQSGQSEETKRALVGMDYDISRKERELDSLKGSDTPLIRKLRSTQLEQMKENRAEYVALTGEASSQNVLYVFVYEQALNVAAENARIKNKCDTVVLSGPAVSDQHLFVNLNSEVGKELAAAKRLHANPKRIGYISADSLLRQMPGYMETSAAKNDELEELNKQLAAKDKEIAAKQKENDSLYGQRSALMRDRGKADEDRLRKERVELENNGKRNIAHNDSIRNKTSIEKMEQATQKLCVSDSCFYIWDKATAQQLSKNQNVFFVNMNDQVAKEIGVYGLPPVAIPPPVNKNNPPPPPPPPPAPKSKAE